MHGAWTMKTTTAVKSLGMHNPPHPGGVFLRLYMEPLGLTVTAAAKRLGVSRKTLSLITNEHAGVSPEIALCIGMSTNTTPESWVGMQAAYELQQAKHQKRKLKVQKLAA